MSLHECPAEVSDCRGLVLGVEEETVEFPHAGKGLYRRPQVVRDTPVGFPVKFHVKAGFIQFFRQGGSLSQGLFHACGVMDGVLEALPGQSLRTDAGMGSRLEHFADEAGLCFLEEEDKRDFGGHGF
jgi:hypothetical protein